MKSQEGPMKPELLRALQFLSARKRAILENLSEEVTRERDKAQLQITQWSEAIVPEKKDFLHRRVRLLEIAKDLQLLRDHFDEEFEKKRPETLAEIREQLGGIGDLSSTLAIEYAQESVRYSRQLVELGMTPEEHHQIHLLTKAAYPEYGFAGDDELNMDESEDE
jgi:hypothetical protein